jgi:hypothetical protein
VVKHDNYLNKVKPEEDRTSSVEREIQDGANHPKDTQTVKGKIVVVEQQPNQHLNNNLAVKRRKRRY